MINPEVNTYTLEISIPPICLEGLSALEIRNFGVKVDDSVPDCAVVKNGLFEWIKLDFTIGKKDEIKT